jgi:hypothetical protein
MKVRSKSAKESSDNKCRQLMLPVVPSMSSSGSIYRVVKSCHYNVCNAPFNYHALRHNDHGVITIFQYLQ